MTEFICTTPLCCSPAQCAHAGKCLWPPAAASTPSTEQKPAGKTQSKEFMIQLTSPFNACGLRMHCFETILEFQRELAAVKAELAKAISNHAADLSTWHEALPARDEGAVKKARFWDQWTIEDCKYMARAYLRAVGERVAGGQK